MRCGIGIGIVTTVRHTIRKTEYTMLTARKAVIMGRQYMSEDITEIRSLVIEKLKKYNQNRQRLAALRYERENFSSVDEDEVISSMNFSHGEAGGTASAGHVSDKTCHIALSYQDEAERQAEEARAAIAEEYRALLKEVERLDHYISLLESQEAAVIRMTYMERRTNGEISSAIGVSARTVRYIRNRALDNLYEMYRLTPKNWK